MQYINICLSSACVLHLFLIMAAVLLLLAMIATPATMTMFAPKTVNAMPTNQASKTEQIRVAQVQHNWIFGAYVLILALTVIGTYLVWSSGNKVQDAIQADANARIGEANSNAASANERAISLEHENLALRTDLNANAGNVALLQKDAADAKAAQQRVELDLGKQREKTARAEKDLAELKETIRPRHLTKEQQAALIEMLSGEPKGPVSVVCVMGDGEGNAFATQISDVLKAAGWTVLSGGVTQAAYSGGDPMGLGIIVHSAITTPLFAARIQRAFFSIGIPLAGAERLDQIVGAATILVGHKPNQAN